MPLSTAARPWPPQPARASKMTSDDAAMATVRRIGTTRHSSQNARAALRRRGGWKVRLWSESRARRRRRDGGLPSHELPAFALAGVAESTATSEFLGTRRPAEVIPELPRNARRPIFAGAIRR